jgi:phospholipase A-2-activating protein
MTYLDEVVKFIEKNTSGVNIGAGSEEYVDPFTGLFACSLPAHSF